MPEPIVMYCTGKWNARGELITPVRVLRTTPKMVVLPPDQFHRRERRELRVSEWSQYHDTWAEAHAYVLQVRRRMVQEASDRLAMAQVNLAMAEALRPPAGS
jgi:hypothetical protein